jgi:histidinol-phosphate/aromatic aminotransferase/cobyric acid decarboxylase-like protein
MSVHHGGTDAGPLPRLDLSTNASPYGPSPIAHAAMQVHVGPYPDPAATTVRATLAEAIGVDPAEIVVGAGATELIDRLVRVLDGPVLVQDPSPPTATRCPCYAPPRPTRCWPPWPTQRCCLWRRLATPTA